MELILITGPDGSGKSTLLDKLEKGAKEQVIAVRVPTIDLDLLPLNSPVLSTATFINYLGKRADETKEHSLKIIAMFGAMAIFGELIKQPNFNQNKTIYCERHPFIDTAVYGQLYLSVMHPKLLNQITATELEKEYGTELEFIIAAIKPTIERTANGACFDLLTFLYHWFSKKENNSIHQLMALFDAPAPNHIYFLAANATTLSNRIEDRNTQKKEFHENEKALTKMEQLYLKALHASAIPFDIVRTDDWEAANQLAADLIKGHL